MRNILSAACLLLFMACNTAKQKADLIVHNAVIYTVDSSFSAAQAMAVKDGKILYTGKEDDVMGKYTADSVVDAKGNAVYPGFIDAHAHFLEYAQSLFAVNLFDCKSEDEMVARVQKFAIEHPDLAGIVGTGWDQNKFPGKQFPNNKKLSQLFPSIPIVLHRVDGHALLANDKALILAGVTPGQTLEGGSVETVNGQLTGILIDNAEQLVSSVIAQPSREETYKLLLAAQQNCFAQGLTTLTDCGLDYTAAEAIDTLQQQGKLPCTFM